MVKKQKEKQYLSATEQRAQGRSRSNNSANNTQNHGVVQKSLPFKCCALTLVPFSTPVCTVVRDAQSKQNYGVVFDNTALMEFVLKHKKDPIRGNPMTPKQIVRLHMDKDSATGDWQCPILTKAFSQHTTKIVAVVSPSGGNEAYVYSYEAYHELNAKPKNYVDLTTGLKFSPKTDVLLLNDPSNPDFQKSVRNVSTFWHIVNARKTNNTASSSSSSNIRKSVTATRVMEAFQKQQDEQKKLEAEKKAAREEATKKKAAADNDAGFRFEIPGSNLPFEVLTEDVTGVKYTSGNTASGLTSTAGSAVHTTVLRTATPDEILDKRLSVMKSNKGKKGYVRMVVQIQRKQQQSSSSSKNIAAPIVIPLLLELHSDIVPRTCTNFLGLCRTQRYHGTIFHRFIDQFMIQGGGEKGKNTNNDKNSSSSRDASLWGYEGFRDEFDDRLKHTGQGILAMANAGPHTNKQQFYITLGKPCPHLDRKHSVFGVVAKGLEEFQNALVANVETDSKDRPFREQMDYTTGETTLSHAVVQILATEVLEDPAMDAQLAEDQRLTELHTARQQRAQSKKRKLVGGNSSSNSSSNSTKAKQQSSGSSSLGVGKYLAAKAASTTTSDGQGAVPKTTTIGLPDIGSLSAPAATKKKKNTKTKFGDFSAW